MSRAESMDKPLKERKRRECMPPQKLPEKSGHLAVRLEQSSIATATESIFNYPERPLDESAGRCKRCGTKQSRSFFVTGPMSLKECAEHPEKPSKRSHLPIWKTLHLAWLVSPPNPPDPNKWYLVRVRGSCPHCEESHTDKYYRRQFGRLNRLILRLRSFCLRSFDLVTLNPH